MSAKLANQLELFGDLGVGGRVVVRSLKPAWTKTRIIIDKTVSSSNTGAEVLRSLIKDDPYENFWVIYLDGQNHIIGVEHTDRGTVSQASPPIRNVFAGALLSCAAAIVCGHNHPSGNPAPSNGDKDFTQELVKAGEVMQVKVLDHIIIGNSIIGSNGYFSFADEGLL